MVDKNSNKKKSGVFALAHTHTLFYVPSAGIEPAQFPIGV